MHVRLLVKKTLSMDRRTLNTQTVGKPLGSGERRHRGKGF